MLAGEAVVRQRVHPRAESSSSSSSSTGALGFVSCCAFLANNSLQTRTWEASIFRLEEAR